MGVRANRLSSSLEALSANEKAVVLDELLAARPGLRGLAETHAAQLMSTEDRVAVAAHVAETLRAWTSRNSTVAPDTSAVAATYTRSRPRMSFSTKPCNRFCMTSNAGSRLA
jgi:hypothetical protein